MLTAVCKNLLLGHDASSSISVLEVESSTSSHTRSLKSSMVRALKTTTFDHQYVNLFKPYQRESRNRIWTGFSDKL
jgi:hypothetical protein